MYVAKAGDRWDLIAHRTLGDAKRAGKVLEQNRIFKLVFEGGEEVTLPEEEGLLQETNVEEVPPWL